jgi:hypothetical protein
VKVQEAPAPAVPVSPFNEARRSLIALLALGLLSCRLALADEQVDSNAAAAAGRETPECNSGEGASGNETERPSDVEGERGGRLYVTQAERREAGLKHPITPWLTASFLLELDGLVEDFALDDGPGGDDFSESGATLQLGLEAAPLDFAKGEWVLEYDTLTGKLATEEAFLSLEAGPWELEAGKLYIPFGVYISHFAIGPILELGETRANAVTLGFAPQDSLDLKLSAYRGSARDSGRDTRDWDWAASLDFWPRRGVQFGLSYQSDLADADSRMLSDSGDRYNRRVGAASGYFLWSGNETELSLEALGALRDFRELDGDRNRPFAWNLEFTRYVNEVFEWSLRIEGSEEVEDEPELQLGPSFTWRLHRTSALTLEYLRGRFKPGLAENDEELSFRHVDRFAAQFSVVF